MAPLPGKRRQFFYTAGEIIASVFWEPKRLSDVKYTVALQSGIGYDDGVNLYQYVRSNPVIYTDSQGLLQEIGYYPNPEYGDPQQEQDEPPHPKEPYDDLISDNYISCLLNCIVKYGYEEAACFDECYYRYHPNYPDVDEDEYDEKKCNCFGLASRKYDYNIYPEKVLSQLANAGYKIDCGRKCKSYHEKCWIWVWEIYRYKKLWGYPIYKHVYDTQYHIVCGECDELGNDPEGVISKNANLPIDYNAKPGAEWQPEDDEIYEPDTGYYKGWTIGGPECWCIDFKDLH
ncbi:hypothetical protein ACFL02_06785 [Planctomycetota bacterium]